MAGFCDDNDKPLGSTIINSLIRFVIMDFSKEMCHGVNYLVDQECLDWNCV
jgi:hypothetical protein